MAINLTRNGVEVHEDFGPTFTYTVFGEDEVIVGYRDLLVQLYFCAHDMKPTVHIKYNEKVKPVNEQMRGLMDIEGKLGEFLPASAFDTEEGASNGAGSGGEEWSPPGELLHTYQNEGKTYQIFKASLLDDKALEILSNMRILVPFFIEGGTIGFLNEPKWSLERWKLFLLYEVTDPSHLTSSSSYSLAGFSTSYRLWVFPADDVTKMSSLAGSKLPETPFDPQQVSLPTPISPLDLQSRERISQFIILPPYQNSSHASYLYNTMTHLFRTDPSCFEITVEEPNEQFDVLRDLNDMAFLTSQLPDKFSALSLPSSISQAELRRPQYVPDMVDPEQVLEIRSKAKLAPRQFQRLLEIALLGTIPKGSRSSHRITRKGNTAGEDDRKYYFWRLMLKERLFIKNKDTLVQLNEEERIGKLEEIMPGVIEEYEERMEQFAKRIRQYGLSDIVLGFRDGWRKTNSVVPKKRKVVESDEEDGDKEGAEDSAVEKKRKIEKRVVVESKKKVGPGAGARSKRVIQTTSDFSEEEEQNTLHE